MIVDLSDYRTGLTYQTRAFTCTAADVDKAIERHMSSLPVQLPEPQSETITNITHQFYQYMHRYHYFILHPKTPHIRFINACIQLYLKLITKLLTSHGSFTKTCIHVAIINSISLIQSH